MPEFPQLSLTKLTPRVDFRPALFRKEILTHGLRYLWEKMARCPCERQLATNGIVKFTSEKRVNCPACDGEGTLFHTPQIVFAITSNSERQYDRFAPYGEDGGDGTIRLTLPVENIPSFRDRFTMLDGIHRYNEVRVRAGTVETLRYPVVVREIVTGDPSDATVPLVIESGVTYARATDINGVIRPINLLEGVDFVVDPAGAIDWTLGDTPTVLTGTATIAGAPTIAVTGTGTSWLANNLVGKQIQIGTEVRTVVTVTNNVTLTVDAPFPVDGTGLVVTLLGTAPIVGARYSITYFCRPVYVVKNMPYSFRNTYTKVKRPEQTRADMPVHADCWLEVLGDG